MAFRPLDPDRRHKSGTPALAYYTRHVSKKRSDGTYRTPICYLYFRVLEHTAKRAGFNAGSPVRFEIDPGMKQARLLRVLNSTRHLSQPRGKSSKTRTRCSYYVALPYHGEITQFFPLAPSIQALSILETSVSEGLIFDLPPPPAAAP